MIATGSVDGAVLFAVSALARTLDADGARPFSTPNPDAAAAWGRGEFERAVTLDPDFGTAWASWIAQTAQAGKPDAAADLAGRALARASLRTPLDKAQIQLSLATLRKDRRARTAALTDLARLAPHDAGPLLGLADDPAASAELCRRQRSSIVACWPSIPGTRDALNSLGYAQGESGDLDGRHENLRSLRSAAESSEQCTGFAGRGPFHERAFRGGGEVFRTGVGARSEFPQGRSPDESGIRALAGRRPGGRGRAHAEVPGAAGHSKTIRWRSGARQSGCTRPGAREQAMAAAGARRRRTRPPIWSGNERCGAAKLTFPTISIS